MATSHSTPPDARTPAAAKYLRPELEALVRALAALPEPERVRVYAAANDEAQRNRPTLSWDEWDRVKASIKLGGNAVEDCDGLYDEP